MPTFNFQEETKIETPITKVLNIDSSDLLPHGKSKEKYKWKWKVQKRYRAEIFINIQKNNKFNNLLKNDKEFEFYQCHRFQRVKPIARSSVPVSSKPITKQSVPKLMTKSSVSPSETDDKVIGPRPDSHQKQLWNTTMCIYNIILHKAMIVCKWLSHLQYNTK